MQDLFAYLRAQAYPGRGILLGLSPRGDHAVAAYFIMGRSENSRNRLLIPQNGGCRAVPHDKSKVEDPSLILYTPAQWAGQALIVANGDHGDTIRARLAGEGTFEEALRARCYEPDAPHFTPRISGLLDARTSGIRLSTLYRPEESSACKRAFYRYDAPPPGAGYLIHTYAGTSPGVPAGAEADAGVNAPGTRLLPFTGPPVEVALPGAPPAADAAAFAATFVDALWSSLSPENRVALYACAIPLRGGAPQTIFRNRHTEGDQPCVTN